MAIGMVIGVIGSCSHLLLALAFDLADAAVLSPLLYTEIIMQTVLGLVLFGDFPDTWSCVGIVLVIAVGVYISFEPKDVQNKAPPTALKPAAGASPMASVAPEGGTCRVDGTPTRVAMVIELGTL